ncbi:MAG: hypothetical protein OXH31_05990 [Gammaproteobacteria bacterium]|nr:hypothetical protein [Gammaproteobacteria bacterium]
MTFIGNVFWFVFGGWALGLVYFLGSIIFFPVFWYLFPISRYAFWPFGRLPISRAAVEKYKKLHPESFSDAGSKHKVVSLTVRRVLGILWALTFGWVLALICLINGLINLLLCIFVVTIPICFPNALGLFKLARVSFVPFTVRILRSKLVEEIEVDIQRSKL